VACAWRKAHHIIQHIRRLNAQHALPAIVGHVVLRKTTFGRRVLATGGSETAARYSGLNTRNVKLAVLIVSSVAACVAGMLYAGRLHSGRFQLGEGDELSVIAAAVLGGTSLFGGRGSAYSAVLGIIVIQSIASGLTLLNLSSSLRFMITGAVLAIAVIVDSLARQSRMSHGRS